MGRISKPQKSKKHKKIKFVDPFYHGERKERMYAGRNLDPVGELEQKISRSQRDLLRRTKLNQEFKNKSRREKKKMMQEKLKKQIFVPKQRKQVTEVEKVEFKRIPGETKTSFMDRVESTTMNAVQEAKMVALMKLKRGGEPADETSQPMSKKKEKLKMKKKLQKEKKQEKLEEKKRDKDDYAHLRDKVEFGDVVTAPPTLSVRPRHAQVSDRPAIQKLLLYDVLKKNAEESTSGSSSKNTTSKSSSVPPPGKATKRKFLSPSQKQHMDRERQKVIDLYRQSKKKTS